MHFRVGGRELDLTSGDVVVALRDVEPEVVRSHAVEVEGRIYPAKQALAVVTGLDRLDFTTVNARRVFQRLGFRVLRVGEDRR